MDDLVKRLRLRWMHEECGGAEFIFGEAADEIERLRAELEKERAACASWWSAYEKHKTENERLRALLNEQKEDGR